MSAYGTTAIASRKRTQNNATQTHHQLGARHQLLHFRPQLPVSHCVLGHRGKASAVLLQREHVAPHQLDFGVVLGLALVLVPSAEGLDLIAKLQGIVDQPTMRSIDLITTEETNPD
jgi:hypothetical protein